MNSKLKALILALLAVTDFSVALAQAEPKVGEIIAQFPKDNDEQFRKYKVITKLGNHMQLLGYKDGQKNDEGFTRGDNYFSTMHVLYDYDMTTKQCKTINFPIGFYNQNMTYIGKLKGPNNCIKYLFTLPPKEYYQRQIIALEYDQTKGKFTKNEVLYKSAEGEKITWSLTSTLRQRLYSFRFFINENAGNIVVFERLSAAQKDASNYSYIVKNYKGDTLSYSNELDTKLCRIKSAVVTAKGNVLIAYSENNEDGGDRWINVVHLIGTGDVKVLPATAHVKGSTPHLFIAGDNQVFVASLYAGNLNKYRGLYIAEISDSTGTIVREKRLDVKSQNITESSKGSGPYVFSATQEENLEKAQSEFNTITAVKLAANGDVAILIEHCELRLPGGGSYYTVNGEKLYNQSRLIDPYYGPAMIHFIDCKNLEQKAFNQIIYNTNGSGFDNGQGIFFVPRNQDAIYCQADRHIYKHALQNNTIGNPNHSYLTPISYQMPILINKNNNDKRRRQVVLCDHTDQYLVTFNYDGITVQNLLD
ncbi:MAG: hypothetical protein RL660_2816 [Bacteroidota bacterium]